jgi:hypothetical protein
MHSTAMIGEVTWLSWVMTPRILFAWSSRSEVKIQLTHWKENSLVCLRKKNINQWMYKKVLVWELQFGKSRSICDCLCQHIWVCVKIFTACKLFSNLGCNLLMVILASIIAQYSVNWNITGNSEHARTVEITQNLDLTWCVTRPQGWGGVGRRLWWWGSWWRRQWRWRGGGG